MTAGQENATSLGESPGGFVFGVQGWTWGEPRPTSITFFLDGTAKVCDQHGRPIKGTVVENKKVNFAMTAPGNHDQPGARSHLSSHAEVIKALEAERVDWKSLSCAGWPQLPYAELIKLPNLPPTPVEELRKIPNSQLRKDAIKARQEADSKIRAEVSESDE